MGHQGQELPASSWGASVLRFRADNLYLAFFYNANTVSIMCLYEFCFLSSEVSHPVAWGRGLT